MRSKKRPTLNSRNRGWMALLGSLETAIKVAKGCLFEPCKLDKVCHCTHNLKLTAEAVARRLTLP